MKKTVKKIQEYRDLLDQIDLQLGYLFELRLLIMSDISKFKTQYKLPLRDKKREHAILKSVFKNRIEKENIEFILLFTENYLKISRKKLRKEYQKFKKSL